MNAPCLILKRGQWPDADRAAWDALFREGGFFDDAGAGVRWSNGTRRLREHSFGHWLGYLARTGQLDLNVMPADRVQPAIVCAFADDTLARNAVSTTLMRIVSLLVLASAFDTARDWSWLNRLAGRLRQRAGTTLKPRASVGSSEIFAWALNEIGMAESMHDSGSWQRPIRFRDGLMVGLLIARPLRLRSFIAISIDRHLAISEAGITIRLGAADTKDHRQREFDLPAELVGPMERYLAEFRPQLIKHDGTNELWVSRRGGPLSYSGFERHLWNITLRAFGEGYRPHAFRHIAATSIAEEDPVYVNMIAGLLGHSTLAMSERHYNRASGVTAAADYQSLIRARRKSSRVRRRPS